MRDYEDVRSLAHGASFAWRFLRGNVIFQRACGPCFPPRLGAGRTVPMPHTSTGQNISALILTPSKPPANIPSSVFLLSIPTSISGVDAVEWGEAYRDGSGARLGERARHFPRAWNVRRGIHRRVRGFHLGASRLRNAPETHNTLDCRVRLIPTNYLLSTTSPLASSPPVKHPEATLNRSSSTAPPYTSISPTPPSLSPASPSRCSTAPKVYPHSASRNPQCLQGISVVPTAF